MAHKFVIKVGGQLVTYSNYDDIPDDLDQVIEFVPEIPPGPHTEEQHEEIESWVPKFKRLMEIERARSSKIR